MLSWQRPAGMDGGPQHQATLTLACSTFISLLEPGLASGSVSLQSALSAAS